MIEPIRHNCSVLIRSLTPNDTHCLALFILHFWKFLKCLILSSCSVRLSLSSKLALTWPQTFPFPHSPTMGLVNPSDSSWSKPKSGDYNWLLSYTIFSEVTPVPWKVTFKVFCLPRKMGRCEKLYFTSCDNKAPVIHLSIPDSFWKPILYCKLLLLGVSSHTHYPVH